MEALMKSAGVDCADFVLQEGLGKGGIPCAFPAFAAQRLGWSPQTIYSLLPYISQ